MAPPHSLNKKTFSLLYIIRVFICTAALWEANELFFTQKNRELE
ncbi:hypothetical protein CU026_2020 [Enterococcus faecium]|uniref:Uncharacterized protein n=1 Tax=Enterococcus faecium R496 TaxID=1134836 RepID=A0AAV3GS01_ENTFC|nr:hypothetical protein HMPREF9527_00447 [Enterococcus faecium TX0133C]EJX48410.1 hypothetical protein HMPREF1378_02898 [Enterococcus faecium R496]EJX85516.1 hypothetical protein HMPREF1368_01504 [Enterococcus faecium ERV69]MBK4753539.1 hypothetical protein [Enterococcus faecium]MBK4756164.1 hypothetical protein [Enterococcus faecium]